MKNYLMIILMMPLSVMAQFSDNFQDGDFLNNPTWNGMDTSFWIDQFTLRSNGPQGLNNIIFLSTPSQSLADAEWDFLLDLSFNPTASNFVRVYLASNQENLIQSSDAYYIEIGQTNADYMKIYKKLSGTSSLLFTGTTSFSSNIKVRIKITHDINGNWQVFSDPTGGNNLLPEGNSFWDNSMTSSAFFGVYCQYSTASRYNQFAFDDFYVGPIQIDTVKPGIVSVSCLNQNQVDILFTEPMEAANCQNPHNYYINNAVGNPVTAITDGINPNLIHLSLTTPLVSETQYQIQFQNLTDISGNSLEPTTHSFVFYLAKAFDIVINEIMADPDPPIGLPNVEYLELFNASGYPISLTSWKILFNSSSKTLPDCYLAPDSFLIITAPANLSQMQAYGQSVGMSGFSLTNTAEQLVLLNHENQVISFVSYTDNWYHDANKSSGGWSLELINPLNPCEGELNWQASVSPTGGTPGIRNSNFQWFNDNKSPYIQRVAVIDSLHIQVFFSEPMDSSTLVSPSTYQIDHEVGMPLGVNLIFPDYISVYLELGTALLPNTRYILTVKDSLLDCSGNPVNAEINKEFAIPDEVVYFDVVINEILVDPLETGEKFIEIYNRSEKVLDVSRLKLATWSNGTLSSVKDIVTDRYLIFPHDYLCITPDPVKVQQSYFSPQPDHFIKIASLPSYPIESGSEVLTNSAFQVIDAFIYNSQDFQYPLLENSKGVSLERIHFDLPTQDVSNWHSAASDVGYATPAAVNSQFVSLESAQDGIQLSPDMFSPDNDGKDDLLSISYSFQEGGYLGNIYILDSRANMIRHLLKSQLLGSSGVIFWDGLTQDRKKASIGIYIVYFEILDLHGKVKHFKKTVVLAGKL